MSRRFKATTAAVMAAIACVLIVGSVASALPTDPPFPSRINLPPSNTGFSPEGIAISGNYAYLPNLNTGGVLKVDLQAGTYSQFIPDSPANTSPLHRQGGGASGAEVDPYGHLWVTGTLGATTPTNTTKGYLFVFDVNTGTELAAYKITDATSKLMNDLVWTPTAVFVSDTTAPNGAGTEVQHELLLGPGGSLPPGGEIDSTGAPLNPAAPAVGIVVPTPGFVSADGIDVLPNGQILFTSVNGTNGAMIEVDPTTFAVTPITVTTPNEPWRPATLAPLLSGDGVTLEGDTLYYPENRAINATCPAPNTALYCPGDIAVVKFDPATDYSTAQVVARLNNTAGIPPLRSVANLEESGHYVYAITRDAAVGGVTQTYLSKIDKNAPLISMQTVLQTEGAGPFTGTVATVVDPAASSATGLTATIDWGDGSAPTTGTVTGSNGFFTVSGTHNFTVPPPGNPFVTVSFADGPNGTSSSSVRAAILLTAAMTATAPSIMGAAGTPVSWGSTVTDTGAAAASTAYTASIAWGDGVTSNGITATGPSGGPFTFSTSHTYARSGTYAPRITVTKTVSTVVQGTATATGSAVISGGTESAFVITPVARTGVEGLGTTGNVATFTDPNGARPQAQYTASINWGDNSPVATGTVGAPTAGVFPVTGNHVYAHAGTYTISLSLADVDGGTGSATTTATISDAALSSTGGAALTGVEGSSVSGVVAKLTDANPYGSPADFIATITWGDGSASSTGVVHQISFTHYTVTGSHIYAEEGGPYPVSVTIKDVGGSTTSTSTSATISDASISATGTTFSGVEGTALTGVTVANITDANTFGSAGDLSATIDWGDGTGTSTGTVSGSGGHYIVTGNHTYASAVPGGTFTVSVSITDDGGSTTSASSTANIAYAPGCIAAGTVHADAHFTMPGTGGPPGPPAATPPPKDIHFLVDATCNAQPVTPPTAPGPPAKALVIANGHVKVEQGPLKIVEAKADPKHMEITTVKITGSTAVIVGTDEDTGNTFVIVLTDGGKGPNANDKASIVVKNATGHVVFDSSTLTAKHTPNVQINTA
jgi:hypothetical protein